MVGDRAKGDRPSIVSEMLDDRNRALAQVAHVDDVIVSDEILSLILSQLSENARLEAVFQDLLDADGSEIYLRPAEQYVTAGDAVTYMTIVEAARPARRDGDRLSRLGRGRRCIGWVRRLRQPGQVRVVRR